MEETLILNFEVDQSKAEKQLEKIEGLLLDNRKAQQELTKAYKEGNITQEEYVKENIRLQANIKKEQDQKKALIRTMETESNSRNAIKQRVSQLAKEYDNLNLKTAQGAKRADELEKELAQLNAQLTKGDKAAGLFKNQIGNYPTQFADAAKSIRIAGVSVGDITGKLAAFANPATAAVGILGALGAAYARSTLGAKDLAFAQAQLSAATTILTNQLAQNITSSEDGQGLVTNILNGVLQIADKIPIIALYSKAVGVDFADIADKSKEIALAQEQLEDLGRLELEIRANASQRLEDNQDLMEQIADDQLTINQRLQAANEVEKSLEINRYNILSVLEEEFDIIQKISNENKDDEDLLNKVGEKRQQINAEAAALERQITKINKLQDDLNAKLGKEAELRRQSAAAELELFGFDIREANAPNISLANETGTASGVATDPVIEASKLRQAQYIRELKTVQESEITKRQAFEQTAQYKKMVDEVSFDTYMSLLGETTNLVRTVSGEQSDIYKIAASAQTVIATYSSATKSYDALAQIPYVGPALGAAAAAAAIASGLANLAQINGVEFAEGGWTGPGDKYDVAGVVHADEYVVPKSVNNSPAAQPHLAALERMRGGYADGGFVANRNTAPAQQALIMANALKNLPVPVVSVAEVTRVQNRIHARERVSTLRP